MYLLAISLFLILFACFVWRKPLWGVYAVIFSLTLYFLKFSVFGIPVTVPEAMIYILALVFLAEILKKKKSFDIQNLWQREPLLSKGIILLFSGAVISTVFSSDTRVSAGILKAWFFDPFLFFLIFTSAVKKEKELLRSLFALALSGFAVALVAIIYWVLPQYSGMTYDGRLRAFYLSANHLAMYLAPAIIIIFGTAVSFIKNYSKLSLRGGQYAGEAIPSEYREESHILISRSQDFSDLGFWTMLIIIFLLIEIPFYLTYSYSAWFGVLAAFIFILAAYYRKNKNRFIFIMIILVISAGIIFPRANPDKFRNIMNFSYPSVSSRAVIWHVAADILKEHWIFGIGPGTFQDYYLKKQADYPPYPEWAVPQPHNIFLAFWLQTGILGLTGFVLILIWFFKAGISVIARIRRLAETKQSPGLESTIAIICCSVMLYIIIHGLVDTTYWKNDLAIIFWLMLSVMYALSNKRQLK